ncbi:MAG: class I SAM-dependent methyltransferase [Nitrospirota bacterium]|nr:class I SAM-dependent methyltransferase [Nitrospirota bacterium]
MDQQPLRALREAEIGMVKSWLRPGLRVLEVGGGNGFQASVLASWGCHVTSIDLPETSAAATYYSVEPYDGQRFPFPDHAFDVVFSSNVLEHVPHLPVILKEITRVIKSDGVVVHILPSSAWRFWTSLAHYVHLARRVGRRFFRPDAGSSESSSEVASPKRNWGVLLKRVFLDGPHGAYPNEFYELYAFSRFRWLNVFAAHGFLITSCFGNGLFYTGYAIFPRLSMGMRRELSRYLGSATWIYVMRPGLQRSPS